MRNKIFHRWHFSAPFRDNEKSLWCLFNPSPNVTVGQLPRHWLQHERPTPMPDPPQSSLNCSSSPTWRFGDMTIITSFTTATIIMILLRSTSCAEWCLSKGGGSCDQLFVSVRQVMISWWSLLREKKFWTAFFRMGRMSTLKIAKRCHCHHRHHHNHQWALNIW